MKNLTNPQNKSDLKGIDGWLVLLGLSIVISPIRLLPILIEQSQLTWKSVSLHYFFSSSVEPSFKWTSYFLVAELFYVVALMALLLWLVYLFFTKHYWFPKVFIVVMLVYLLFKPLDELFIHLIFPDQPLWRLQDFVSYLRNSVYFFISVPYVLLSRRVKNTFVEGCPTNMGTSSP